MTSEERKQEKVNRYKALASTARQESEELAERSSKMADVIPFGQPILVGHHSEKVDRSYRGKITSMMDKAIEADKKAEYYEQKAKAAESNNAIYLGDEDSVERLEKKVADLTDAQEKMKAVNKIIRSKKLADVEKIDKIKELGFSEKNAVMLMTPDYMGCKGFASYQLTNNNAALKKAKERLEEAQKMKSTEDKEYSIGDVDIVENYTENRLQLFFPGKPDDEIRDQLKHNAFRWSPRNGCWQSFLNAYQIRRMKDILKDVEL